MNTNNINEAIRLFNDHNKSMQEILAIMNRPEFKHYAVRLDTVQYLLTGVIEQHQDINGCTFEEAFKAICEQMLEIYKASIEAGFYKRTTKGPALDS